MKPLASIFASPVACLIVLGGIVLEGRTHIKPEDASPYHAAVKARLEAWPQTVRSADAEWSSRTTEVPAAAIQLLRPNALVSRHYECYQDQARNFDLLVVQCGEPTDMSGHYPGNCYPANGEPLAHKEPRVWQVGDQVIQGVEYHFEPRKVGLPRRCVYNFFVLPGRGIVPDMQDVRRASADYRRRYYGAAQFQVIFYTDLSQAMRDDIFSTIIGADPGIFKVLNPPGL